MSKNVSGTVVKKQSKKSFKNNKRRYEVSGDSVRFFLCLAYMYNKALAKEGEKPREEKEIHQLYYDFVSENLFNLSGVVTLPLINRDDDEIGEFVLDLTAFESMTEYVEMAESHIAESANADDQKGVKAGSESQEPELDLNPDEELEEQGLEEELEEGKPAETSDELDELERKYRDS